MANYCVVCCMRTFTFIHYVKSGRSDRQVDRLDVWSKSKNAVAMYQLTQCIHCCSCRHLLHCFHYAHTQRQHQTKRKSIYDEYYYNRKIDAQIKRKVYREKTILSHFWPITGGEITVKSGQNDITLYRVHIHIETRIC